MLNGLRQQAIVKPGGVVEICSGVHCCVIAAGTIAQLKNNVKIARAFVPLKKE
ncbi:hypothetical protein [Nostoc sp.]|uniref:hypothetical protein n=1 Tax=Nostoc sp. TaxID=1180 RepID=UPI002FF6D661